MESAEAIMSIKNICLVSVDWIIKHILYRVYKKEVFDSKFRLIWDKWVFGFSGFSKI